MCLDIFYRLFIGMWEPLDSNFVSGLIATHTHRSPYHSDYKVCAKVYWRWRHPNKHSVSDLLSEIKSRFAWYTINLLTLILRIGRQLEKSTLQLGAFTYLHICIFAVNLKQFSVYFSRKNFCIVVDVIQRTHFELITQQLYTGSVCGAHAIRNCKQQ